jgi:hypothetical protein
VKANSASTAIAPVEPRQGGDIETVASGPPRPPDQKRMTGRILVWDPPHVFEPSGTNRSSSPAWSATNCLEAHLAGAPLPNWADRYREIAGVSPMDR